jgi:hypothetical protein
LLESLSFQLLNEEMAEMDMQTYKETQNHGSGSGGGGVTLKETPLTIIRFKRKFQQN